MQNHAVCTLSFHQLLPPWPPWPPWPATPNTINNVSRTCLVIYVDNEGSAAVEAALWSFATESERIHHPLAHWPDLNLMYRNTKILQHATQFLPVRGGRTIRNNNTRKKTLKVILGIFCERQICCNRDLLCKFMNLLGEWKLHTSFWKSALCDVTKGPTDAIKEAVLYFFPRSNQTQTLWSGHKVVKWCWWRQDGSFFFGLMTELFSSDRPPDWLQDLKQALELKA